MGHSPDKSRLPVVLGGNPVRTAPYTPFPRTFGGELDEVARVLRTDDWIDGHAVRRFEEAFAAYTGARYVVAVNTGGMALQMALRALGIVPGDEVLVRVDCCAADAFSVLNAGAAPVFADSDPDTFNLDFASADAAVGPQTRAVVATHLWGRPEDMDEVNRLAERRGLIVIDDACAACGAEWRGRKAGTLGRVGVCSFGSMKPFQAGGGGAIVTDDEALARELRGLRAWGDLESEFGVRDWKELAWNGRMSDVLAAVLLAQLRGYPDHLAQLEAGAHRLEALLEGLPGIRPLPRDPRITAEARTLFLLRVDETALGCPLDAFARALMAEGVPSVWHGAFEPIVESSFFGEGRWRTWTLGHPDPRRLAENYGRPYPGADRLYRHVGLGLDRRVLCSGDDALRDVAEILARLCTHADRLPA